MRTTLDLSASLLEEAMALTKIRTKTEVITRALENLIQKEKVQQHTINNIFKMQQLKKHQFLKTVALVRKKRTR